MRFLLITLMILAALPVKAQNIFWSFSDNQQPLTIAPECDGRFEEIRGGVFMPSVEEVYEHGQVFLESTSDEIRRQAPYCFLFAALQGHADAQFQLAKLYNKGDLLPQDDLSAYKWSFIAAANGNKDAEVFVLNLEQVLTTKDMDAVSGDIRKYLDAAKDDKRKKMDEISKEMATLKTPGADSTGAVPSAPIPTDFSDIFTEEDRF